MNTTLAQRENKKKEKTKRNEVWTDEFDTFPYSTVMDLLVNTPLFYLILACYKVRNHVRKAL